MARKAFTLIELLVVIAVIAVLMGILMPALRAAKDHAKRIHCVSNVKTLTLGWLMYKDDNDNKIVGAHTNPDNWVLRPPHETAPLELKLDTIRDGLLYKYVGETIDVYRCPADFRIKNAEYDAFRSYSLPGGANGEHDKNTTTAAKKYSDIRRPSEKYLFLEDIDPRGYNIGSWIMGFQPDRWIDPLALWHNRQSTLGWADGHAGMHRWADKSFLDWAHKATFEPKTFHFDKTPPADERTDIEFMSKGYPCKSHK